MLSYLQGFVLSAGLIIAIGAQNAFVIRQGLKQEYRFFVAGLSAVLDALLILLGVLGMGALVIAAPALLFWIKWIGALYLFGFGLFSFRSALKSRRLEIEKILGRKSSFQKILALCLSFSLLNPHCYLDTLVMLGSVSTTFEGDAKIYFSAGAMTASFVWFFSLVYGASVLSPLFKKAIAWTVLDAVIGVLMWLIALGLIFQDFSSL